MSLIKEIDVDIIDNRFIFSKISFPTFNNDTNLKKYKIDDNSILYKKGLKDIEINFKKEDDEEKIITYKGNNINNSNKKYFLKKIKNKYYLFKIDSSFKINRKIECLTKKTNNEIKIKHEDNLSKHLESKLRNYDFIEEIKELEEFEKYDKVENSSILINKVIK